MAKRRTQEDFDFNAKVLEKLFNQHSAGGNTATITYTDLIESGYKGSMSYSSPSPSGAGNYLIRQLPAKRNEGISKRQYSIFKMFN